MPLEILVPFWGDPAMLRETVHSVLDQTSDDWTLTVVDDGYPDPAVAEFFATLTDPRITYLRNEVNLGITDNYRRCVELAREDLVVILGCDDVLLPHYVEVVLAAHRARPDATIIQPGVQVIDERGRVVTTLVDTVKQRVTMPRGRGRRVVRGEALAASLLRADWLYWPSLVFKREALAQTPFRDGLPIIQDLALVIDVVAAGGSLLIEPEVCFSYRRHTASASSAKLLDGSRFAGELEYFTLAAAQMEALGWKRAARAARWHLTSRAHALTLVPRAVVTGNRSAAGVLLGHVSGRIPVD
ncbi:MAG TPA: glycosyltransferase family 2 protein [Actinotalea sp.]|jgi:glycosyltransferase involved in cell wall biosynthesis